MSQSANRRYKRGQKKQSYIWLLREIAALAPDLSPEFCAQLAKIVDHCPKQVRLITAPRLSDESGTRPHHQRTIPPQYRRQYLAVVLSEVIVAKQVGVEESELTADEWYAHAQNGQVIDRKLVIRAAEAPILDTPEVLSGALSETPDLPASPHVDPAVRLRKNTAGLARAARLDRGRPERKQALVKRLDWTGYDCDRTPQVTD